MAQTHQPGGPAVVDEIRHREFGDLAHQLVAGGAHIDVLVVAEFGVDAQVGATADGVGEDTFATADDLARRVEGEGAGPVAHGRPFIAVAGSAAIWGWLGLQRLR